MINHPSPWKLEEDGIGEDVWFGIFLEGWCRRGGEPRKETIGKRKHNKNSPSEWTRLFDKESLIDSEFLYHNKEDQKQERTRRLSFSISLSSRFWQHEVRQGNLIIFRAFLKIVKPFNASTLKALIMRKKLCNFIVNYIQIFLVTL